MAPDDQPDVPVDLLAQLRGALDSLNTIAARVPGVAQAAARLPNLPSIPAPGQTTAAQVSAIVGAVRAQRATIQALRTNLDAFEQQLEVLERLLEPLESLSRAWAKVERGVTGEAGPAGDRHP